MVSEYSETMDKSKVVASPKDEVLDGVVVRIQKGFLSEFVDPAYHSKFDNLEQEHLLIHFDVKFEDKILKGSDRVAYYSEPMTNSKLGKYLLKYGELKVGQSIKIDYDGDGFAKIKLK